jgi:UDPglucose--hexose-1-phosphate uridylyltransferase
MTGRYRSNEPSTSELRHDWLCDRWVIIAPQRNERPDDFAPSTEPMAIAAESEVNCPFCCGNECETPPALAVYSADGQTDADAQWLVRVVPNKFPAVNGVQTLKFATLASVEGVKCSLGSDAELPGDLPFDLGSEAAATAIDLFHVRNVSGAHEVIIESPQHLCSLTQLDRTATTMIFRAYRDRLLYWSRCPDIAYAVVFKNVGLDAGASLVHTHSQLIATNILPPDVRRSVERMELFEKTEHACLFCRMLKDELEENVRIVAETKDFVAFCPFASRLPSLVTVVPREHQSSFERVTDESIEQLAWLVHRLVRSIEICYPQAAYNYVLHTAPRGKRHSPAFHWRIEIFPRLTRVAGFEWGSDCFINPLPPELAARRLRNQRIDL